MWAAEWPPARFSEAGEPSMSTNPIIDYHIVHGLVLIVLATCRAGNTWGFGKRWAELPTVEQNRWLLWSSISPASGRRAPAGPGSQIRS